MKAIPTIGGDPVAGTPRFEDLGPRHWETFDPRSPTKVAGRTSKYCPHCLKKSGAKVRRTRYYSISIPLLYSQCAHGLPVHHPRLTASDSWWNRGDIRWWLAPEDSFPWFECLEHAECPIHGREEVRENCYKRQFGRLKLAEFLLTGAVRWEYLRPWEDVLCGDEFRISIRGIIVFCDGMRLSPLGLADT